MADEGTAKRQSGPTAKLARCRCTPSHLDPHDCPEYTGMVATEELVAKAIGPLTDFTDPEVGPADWHISSGRQVCFRGVPVFEVQGHHDRTGICYVPAELDDLTKSIVAGLNFWEIDGSKVVA